LDLEISLVKAFGWSLAEIDRTNVESLMPFLRRFNATQGSSAQEPRAPSRRVYCDDPAASWL
jgi:hypothetical protein